MNKAIHSSNRDDWGTPAWLFGWFDRRYRFTMDSAATTENTLVGPDRFAYVADSLRVVIDGLKDNWGSTTWCNPPYGRGITGQWVRRAYEQTRKGRCAVVLVQCRTSESWWEWANKATIRFEIRGRVKFKGAPTGAPFPSAVLVFTPWHDGPPLVTTLDRDAMIREHEEKMQHSALSS